MFDTAIILYINIITAIYNEKNIILLCYITLIETFGVMSINFVCVCVCDSLLLNESKIVFPLNQWNRTESYTYKAGQ